ncbi:hypothetical protein CYY_003913 [Polysphondylium violaceum]|uniref:SHSP domain-containing protein n=1 Tax=Polysphondylium violaceum TaxID=133409 RepID=A0A8J4PW22_9MYCE|nr:hypothetical protein CYY_003913 [Polysphondylium violaceum]
MANLVFTPFSFLNSQDQAPHNFGPHQGDRFHHERSDSQGPHSHGPHHRGPHHRGPHSHGPHSHGPHSHGPHHRGPHHGDRHERPSFGPIDFLFGGHPFSHPSQTSPSPSPTASPTVSPTASPTPSQCQREKSNVLFGCPRSQPQTDKKEQTFHPDFDVYEDNEFVFIELEVAGLAKEDINIDWNTADSKLVISGEKAKKELDPSQVVKRITQERKFGSFNREVVLNANYIDLNSIEATFKDGLLLIKIAKKDESSLKVKINIQ